ncbi:hypothetical protein WJX81_002707 [Elliptochloris bilobata]|uniref:JmjC domain-containing protein n=1 Tax=Elliptochloris bilobata TaxID=381761 RepID=A0AAW1RH67_9CHLO
MARTEKPGSNSRHEREQLDVAREVEALLSWYAEKPGAVRHATAVGLAEAVGYGREVATMDSATQDAGPRWNAFQYSRYWHWRTRQAARAAAAAASGGAAPAAEQLRAKTEEEDEADSRDLRPRGPPPLDSRGEPIPPAAVKGISAESRLRVLRAAVRLHGTPLQTAVTPPTAVRSADLSVLLAADAPGRAVLALAPPTPRNLAAHAAARASRRAGVAFAVQACEGALSAEPAAGDTLFVPGGWIASEATAEASTALAGAYLAVHSAAEHLAAARLEDALRLPARSRFPGFRQVMFLLAAGYAPRVRALAGLDPEDLAFRVAMRAALRQTAQAAAAAPAANGESFIEEDGAGSRDSEDDFVASEAADSEASEEDDFAAAESPEEANPNAGSSPSDSGSGDGVSDASGNPGAAAEAPPSIPDPHGLLDELEVANDADFEASADEAGDEEEGLEEDLGTLAGGTLKEEEGESCLEASRGAKGGAAKKKPSVKSRLMKKLRIK